MRFGLTAAEMGAHIVITDIPRAPERIGEEERRAGWRGLASLADEIVDLGRRCEIVFCDITCREEVEALVLRAYI